MKLTALRYSAVPCWTFCGSNHPCNRLPIPYYVRPGDMVVAGGDGVIVVPREEAGRVAEIAWDIAKGSSRNKLCDLRSKCAPYLVALD